MVAELVSSLGISEVFYQYLSDPRTYLKSLEVRPILKREVVSRIDKLIRYLETATDIFQRKHEKEMHDALKTH